MHLVVDGVLDGALLLLEGRLELVEVLAARLICKGNGVVRRGGGRVVAGWWQGASIPAASSASTRALKPLLASAMSSVRTSCHDE